MTFCLFLLLNEVLKSRTCSVCVVCVGAGVGVGAGRVGPLRRKTNTRR